MNYKEVESILNKHGFEFIRDNGHARWELPGTTRYADVPRHGGNKDISFKTLKSIWKQSGFPEYIGKTSREIGLYEKRLKQQFNKASGAEAAAAKTPDPAENIITETKNRFGDIDSDNVITDEKTIYVENNKGETLTISRNDNGSVDVAMTDKYGAKTSQTIEAPKAASFLSDMGKRLGTAGGAALGVVAAVTALSSGASTAQAAEIMVDVAVPYGEAARKAAQGDLRGAAKAALSETAGNIGCVSGGSAMAATGFYLGAGAGAPTGPGAFLTGLLGGAGGALVGCLGGALMASIATEAGFELIVPEDISREELVEKYADKILDKLPAKSTPNMPPELQALVSIKNRIMKLEPGSEAHDQAMNEFKEHLNTELNPDTTKQVLTYLELKDNRQLSEQKNSEHKPSALSPQPAAPLAP
jgi:predicted RNA binding protein YcfA (HicA-like mRNA interferase family)